MFPPFPISKAYRKPLCWAAITSASPFSTRLSWNLFGCILGAIRQKQLCQPTGPSCSFLASNQSTDQTEMGNQCGEWAFRCSISWACKLEPSEESWLGCPEKKTNTKKNGVCRDCCIPHKLELPFHSGNLQFFTCKSSLVCCSDSVSVPYKHCLSQIIVWRWRQTTAYVLIYRRKESLCSAPLSL